jgi:endoglucanase Acf2
MRYESAFNIMGHLVRASPKKETQMKKLAAIAMACGFVLCVAGSAQGQTQTLKLGLGSVVLAPKGGDKGMPSAPHRTEAMQKLAAPTNQWYSSLIFNAQPEVIYALPLTVKLSVAGVELALPSKEVVPTERRDVEIHYPHRDPLLISPVAFEPAAPKLAKNGDWSIDAVMARGADEMRVTLAHGGPYVQVQISRGDVRLRLPAAAERFDLGGDARVLALRVKGKAYALFGPTGVRWDAVSPTEWIGRLPEGKGYLAAAALPNEQAATLALFTRHAYAFVEDTRVDWRYDQNSSQVQTTFKTTTRIMEGADNGPLLGLYPHHWFNNAALQGQLGPAFDSVRGKIKLLAASQFKTTLAYNGFVPYWPGIKASPRLKELGELLEKDQRDARRMMLQEGKGAYWQGKGLQRNLKLMDVAEQQGDREGQQRLLAMVSKRMEEWLAGQNNKSYFQLDKSLGAVASFPDEFFTVEQINDHHFTYGYWIRAAAEIALRDPAWAAPDKWGGMIELLVADIATMQRGRADFPFLRNFDPYEGHSWASGVGLGPFGNNQESSSEAINAWAGLILWGEVTANRDLRDLGVYLLASEAQAIEHYWFDIHGQVFPPEYKNVEASMIFGGKYAHNTWWTDEPRQIKGINLIPITTASLYLGRDTKFVKRNLEALRPEMALYAQVGKKPPSPPPADVWQDIFAKYAALADPAQGLAQWDRWGAVELGDSRSHALHWLLSLNEMGAPDFSVSANTALYSVFRKADGGKTYLAFNAGKAPITVRFSDGKELTVAPGALAQTPQATPATGP